MKLYNYLTLSLLTLTLVLTGCEKPFDALEKDPNRAVNATPSLILNGILNDMYGTMGSPWGETQRWNQFYCSNYNYYANNEYSWTTTGFNFATLKNVVKMEEEAVRAGAAAVNPYSALGKFFRAYFYHNMTRRVGDVPLADALKGLDNTTPKYDSQKAVYAQIIKWLDEANDELATSIQRSDNTLAGDIYLGNNLSKWRKVVNSLKLRVLVDLSKKEGEADLNVKAKFAEILGNPAKYPLLESIDDNLQYTHNSINKYPRNPSNFGFNATRENMAKTYVDLLKDRKDARLFVVAEPSEAQIKAGKKATDFDAYVGASSGEDLADMSSKAGQGVYSFQNRARYYSNDIGEKVALVGYIEQCFNIAEGLNRGWATGNAEDFYKKGITASMNFYGITNQAALDTYLNGELVKYAGNTAAGLSQILTQKYIGFFQNSGLEAFYNQRRTGIPAFLVGVGTGNSGRVPKRWQYPNNERTTNQTNLSAAVTSQYAGTDDVNAVMWLIK